MKIIQLLPILALAFAPMLRAQESKTTEAKPAKPANPANPAKSTEEKPAEKAPVPVIDKALLEKVSYFYGTRMASEFVENGVNIEVDSLAQGLRDTIAKTKPKYEQKDLEGAMNQFAQAMMAKQQKDAAEAGSKNVIEAEKFLTENAKRKEVTTTASGLQYEVLKKGEGAKPAASDTVSVHYHGTLISGKVFDSSVQRGEPATFPVGGVIPGWVEALQLMPVGSKYKLFIPSKLAYGEQGAGPDITPNSALVFEVELLSIAPKK